MTTTHKAKLTGLTTRESITDAIYRVVAAYDTNDYPLLTTALTPDVVFTMGEQSMKGIDAVKTQNFDLVGLMDTSHLITNVRVDVAGDDATTATAHCNALAQHYPAGTGSSNAERRLLVGARYAMQLVRDPTDGLWRVKDWVLDIAWKEGDDSVFNKATW